MEFLLITNKGIRLNLYWLELATNWELIALLVSLWVIVKLYRANLSVWNWSGRARAIGDGLKITAFILALWVGSWLLFAGQFPPNPLA